MVNLPFQPPASLPKKVYQPVDQRLLRFRPDGGFARDISMVQQLEPHLPHPKYPSEQGGQRQELLLQSLAFPKGSPWSRSWQTTSLWLVFGKLKNFIHFCGKYSPFFRLFHTVLGLKKNFKAGKIFWTIFCVYYHGF